MIHLIEKRPYSSPTIIELDVRTISDLERELDTHFTQISIGAGLYLLIKVNEDFEETNLILGDKVISGTVYVIKGTHSKLISTTEDDMINFKAVARFIEFN